MSTQYYENTQQFLHNNKKRSQYNKYDSSLKLFFASGGNIALAVDLQIPHSTVISWKRTDFSKLVTHPLTGSPKNDLILFRKFIQDRFAMRLFSAYTIISSSLHFVFSSAIPDFNSILNNSKETILKTIDSVKNIIGLAKSLKLFRISRQRYDMWRKNKQCSASHSGLCVKKHPLQISKNEIAKLKSFLSSFNIRNWPLNSVYLHGLRNNIFAFSLSTFYKYAHVLGFSTFLPKNRHKNHSIGLRAVKPNQYWHADVTIFKPLDNTKVYIYLVIDNFSRYILSCRASLEYSAKIRLETVMEAYHNRNKNSSNIINLVVDGGSENKTIPLHPSDELSIHKIIAQQDILFSNSMIESVNKQIKYIYLFQKDLFDFNAVVKHLEISIPDFNNIRPYAPLHGLTPAEVYIQGLLPDKTIFMEQLETAKIKRYTENTSKTCPLCKD